MHWKWIANLTAGYLMEGSYIPFELAHSQEASKSEDHTSSRRLFV